MCGKTVHALQHRFVLEYLSMLSDPIFILWSESFEAWNKNIHINFAVMNKPKTAMDKQISENSSLSYN